MKKAALFLICTILVLCTACASTPAEPQRTEPTPFTDSATTESTPFTDSTTTEATTTQVIEATTEVVVSSEPGAYENNLYKLYYDVILECREMLAREDGSGEGFLTDIDGNGISELAMMYTAVEGQNSMLLCDLYTVEDGLVIPLLQKHIVYYNNAGGPNGFIGAVELNGVSYFVVRNNYADWVGYGDESLPESIGHWELYTLKDAVLAMEAEVSFDLVQNNGNLDVPCVPVTDKFDSYPMEVLPDASTITKNDAPMTAEEYGLWLDSMIIMEQIDGFCWDDDSNSLEALQSYCSLELFRKEAEAQGANPDELWYQWHDFMGFSDSAAWAVREWTETDDGVRMELAILHENPMNRGTGIDQAETLAEKVAVQYRYWEETGELDYMHIDKNTPPHYQVTSIAINASSCYTQVQIRINGVDFGTCTLDHQVLLLPVNSEPMTADAPAVVELMLLSGTLPAEGDVFVCLGSNISGAR